MGANVEFEEIAVELVPTISELDVIAEDITVGVADNIVSKPEPEKRKVALTTELSTDMMLEEELCREDMLDEAVLERFWLVDSVEL